MFSKDESGIRRKSSVRGTCPLEIENDPSTYVASRSYLSDRNQHIGTRNHYM